jgi:predicted XRE-type DNA-binding protein
MKTSNKEMIKLIERTKREKKDLTHITDKSRLSTEDKVKMSLCKHLVRYAVTRRLKLKELGKLLRMPPPRVSEIANYKIDKFTVDWLLSTLSVLAKQDAQIRAYLEFFEQAAEVPALAVTKTKKLTRDLKEASVHV